MFCSLPNVTFLISLPLNCSSSFSSPYFPPAAGPWRISPPPLAGGPAGRHLWRSRPRNRSRRRFPPATCSTGIWKPKLSQASLILTSLLKHAWDPWACPPAWGAACLGGSTPGPSPSEGSPDTPPYYFNRHNYICHFSYHHHNLHLKVNCSQQQEHFLVSTESCLPSLLWETFRQFLPYWNWPTSRRSPWWSCWCPWYQYRTVTVQYSYFTVPGYLGNLIMVPVCKAPEK